MYNLLKPFKTGHTHLKTYKACRDAVYFVTTYQLPSKPSVYYLESLRRISNDSKYITKIENELSKRSGGAEYNRI